MKETDDTIYDLENEANLIDESNDNHENCKEPVDIGDSEEPEKPDGPEESDGQEESDAKRELNSIMDAMTPEEMLEIIRKGNAYNEDVKAARIKGEIAGRNARIEQLLEEVRTGSDTPPNLSSGASAKRRVNSIFDLADLCS